PWRGRVEPSARALLRRGGRVFGAPRACPGSGGRALAAPQRWCEAGLGLTGGGAGEWGEVDGDAGAAAAALAEPDRAAVRLHDRAADREAEAEPFLLGRVERLQRSVRFHAREAAAAVADREADPTVRAGGRRDVQIAVAALDLAHRLARVHDQLQQQLLELDRIAVQRRQLRIQAARDADPAE